MRRSKIDQTATTIGPPGEDLESYLSRTLELSMAEGLTAWEIVALVDELEERWGIRLHRHRYD